MADIDLPVFSFRANRETPMIERLSFLTDVLRAQEGAEQRRSLRLTPRRGFSGDLLLTGAERTFFDLFNNRLAGQEMMVPLYWDVVPIASATVAGFTSRIAFNTVGHEFAVGLAILQVDALRYEVVEIVAVDPAGIDLAQPTDSAWPAGTRLFPLRRALLNEVGAATHHSASVQTVTVTIGLTVANPRTPPADLSVVYQGLPVLLTEPNWSERLTTTYERLTTRLDNEFGLPFQVDALNRALAGQSHRWFLNGRQALASYRDMLYQRRGRAIAFWCPTFKADIELRAAALSAATQLVITNVGMVYVGGPTAGREYISIRHSTGTIFRRIVSALPGLVAGTERINLDSPIGLDLSPGQVRKISFMEASRFDQDDFEIVHHSGADGMHECNAVIRNFVNTRTAPVPVHYPIPTSVQDTSFCGVEAPGSCYFNAFEGYYAKLRVTWLDASTPSPLLGYFIGGAGWNVLVGDGPANPEGKWDVVDFQYIEAVIKTPLVMNPQQIDLRLQFAFDTVSTAMRATVSFRRWTDNNYSPLTPKIGSSTLGVVFDVFSLFPGDWFFDV